MLPGSASVSKERCLCSVHVCAAQRVVQVQAAQLQQWREFINVFSLASLSPVPHALPPGPLQGVPPSWHWWSRSMPARGNPPQDTFLWTLLLCPPGTMPPPCISWQRKLISGRPGCAVLLP